MYCTRCDFDLDVARRIITFDSLAKADRLFCVSTVCSCTITAPPGHHIRLEMSVFQLTDGGLEIDWFYVYDGNTTNTLLGSFTGVKRPFTVQSRSRFMMLQLRRQYSFFRSTFKGSYNYSTTKGKLMFILVQMPYSSYQDVECYNPADPQTDVF